MKLKPLEQQVLVVTGATSGIGLAVARAAARRGAGVVLVGRDEDAVRGTTREIGSLGPRALGIAGDVANVEEVQRIVTETEAAFGGFDTWVNNAGIAVYGRLTEVALEDQRRLFDVNYWGVVHGSLAAVRHLRHHGPGAVINIGSVESDRSFPLNGAYAASKHAVKAFTDALRMEVEEASLAISVSLVKPGSIDTPLFAHARSVMAYEPAPPPPVYAPEEVAHAVLRCAERPTRQVTVGGAGRLLTFSSAVAPRLTDWAMERTLFRAQQGAPAPGGRPGNLYTPQEPHVERGSYPGRVLSRSAYTRAVLSPGWPALPFLLTGVMVGAAAAWLRRA